MCKWVRYCCRWLEEMTYSLAESCSGYLPFVPPDSPTTHFIVPEDWTSWAVWTSWPSVFLRSVNGEACKKAVDWKWREAGEYLCHWIPPCLVISQLITTTRQFSFLMFLAPLCWEVAVPLLSLDPRYCTVHHRSLYPALAFENSSFIRNSSYNIIMPSLIDTRTLAYLLYDPGQVCLIFWIK